MGQWQQWVDKHNPSMSGQLRPASCIEQARLDLAANALRLLKLTASWIRNEAMPMAVRTAPKAATRNHTYWLGS